MVNQLHYETDKFLIHGSFFWWHNYQWWKKPMTVFWPQLCAVDDICGPLTSWNWWCSGQRPSSAATVWNRLPADIRTSTCTVQTIAQKLKTFYASRRIWGFFILHRRNWLIIIIIIEFFTCLCIIYESRCYAEQKVKQTIMMVCSSRMINKLTSMFNVRETHYGNGKCLYR